MNLKYDHAVVLALGCNLPGAYGSVAALLDAATERLAQAGLRILARSPWWRSTAWPDASAPPFINGVALIDTKCEAHVLLADLQAMERVFGRQGSPRNAPRTLDLDLIAHGRCIIETAELILPHPRAAQRRFVMGPLAQIAPDWRHPVSGETAAALAVAATVGRDAEPL